MGAARKSFRDAGATLGLLVLVGGACACGVTPPGVEATDASQAPGVPGASLGGGVDDPLDTGDASTAHRTARLFATTCSGGPEAFCHGNNAAGLGLRLGRGGGDVIGVPSSELPTLLRVKPGDPAHSYLFVKVLQSGQPRGGRMPLAMPHDARIETLVRTWIEDGAPVE